MKFLFCCCVVFLTSLSIFMIFTLNSLSDKSYISISLELFSRDWSYTFVWNIFSCFFIFFDSLCWSLCIRQKMATSPSLHKLAFHKRRPSSISLSRDSGGLSNHHASPNHCHGDRPHEKPNLPTPRSWTCRNKYLSFKPHSLWNSVMEFCYGSQEDLESSHTL